MGIRSMTMKMEFDSGLFRREVLRVGNQKSVDYKGNAIITEYLLQFI